MAGKRLYVDLDWDPSEMRDQVTDMDDRSDEFKPVFRKMRNYFERRWSNNFLSHGLEVGGWKPLDAEYAAWKSAHFPGAPPMIRSGSLFQSIRDLRGAPNEINKSNATFGTNVKYAKFHQYGTTKMAKREIVFEPVEFRREWGDKIAKYIVDGQV